MNVASQVVDGEIEHLIIDGKSEDGSIEILKENTAKFPHLRWISEPDSGQSNAMNKGIKMAAGKWLGILNADDFYEPGILPEVLSLLKKNPDRNTFITGNLLVRNDFDEVISLCQPASISLPFLLADICTWPYNPSAYFYPKALHDSIGFYDENEHFAMDYDFIIRLALAGISMEYYNQTWGNFRMQVNAKTYVDQQASLSWERSEKIRNKYFQKAGMTIRLYTILLKKGWAVRNKILGLYRKIGK
jgi:glycosyltransferase involved in cell wall biosynthesis